MSEHTARTVDPANPAEQPEPVELLALGVNLYPTETESYVAFGVAPGPRLNDADVRIVLAKALGIPLDPPPSSRAVAAALLDHAAAQLRGQQ